MISSFRYLLNMSMETKEALRMLLISASSLGHIKYAMIVLMSTCSNLFSVSIFFHASLNSPGNASLVKTPRRLPFFEFCMMVISFSKFALSLSVCKLIVIS